MEKRDTRKEEEVTKWLTKEEMRDGFPIIYTNSIDMKFIQIPAGEFEMGSLSQENNWYNNEQPVHTVKIKKSFYLGKYLVTQKQWVEIMDSNPSKFRGDDRPVDRVSWNNAQEFVKKINEKEGTDKYRLPSEAEWEYACRAGTSTRYAFGDSESKLEEYCYCENLDVGTHPVGQRNLTYGDYMTCTEISGNGYWTFTRIVTKVRL